MMRHRWFILAVLITLAVPAAAHGVPGRWKADIDTPGFGVIPTVFEFKVDGGTLTGTFINSFIPEPIPISGGTVKGNVVSFTLKPQTLTLEYKGPLKGDTLTLTTKVVEGTPPGPAELTFTTRREK
jgi:hypothetical protein